VRHTIEVAEPRAIDGTEGRIVTARLEEGVDMRRWIAGQRECERVLDQVDRYVAMRADTSGQVA
jgi:hypothetical protein